MAAPEKKKVICPKCGREIEVNIWHSISTEEEKNAVEDIISGKLFEVRCEGCGSSSRMNYPMMLNDMVHNILIYYASEDQNKNSERVMTIFEREKMPFRIVNSQEALREKAAIFKAGLDDRVVEVLKFVVLSQMAGDLAGKDVDAVCFCIKPNGAYCLEMVVGNERIYTDELGEGLYEAVKETMGEQIEKMKEQRFIDAAWVRKLMKMQ